MKRFYPAIFCPKGYELEFPDVKGCFTMGGDIDECHRMAQEALELMLDSVDEKDYPVPSDISDIDLSNYPEGSFVSLVCFEHESRFE